MAIYIERHACGQHIRTGRRLTEAEARSCHPDERGVPRATLTRAQRALWARRRKALLAIADPAAVAALPARLREVWDEIAGGLTIEQIAGKRGLSRCCAADRWEAARRTLGLPRLRDVPLEGGDGVDGARAARSA